MARQYDIGRGVVFQDTGGRVFDLGRGFLAQEITPRVGTVSQTLATVTYSLLGDIDAAGALDKTLATLTYTLDGALEAVVTPPVTTTDVPSGGWGYHYDPYIRRRKPKKDEPDEPTAEDQQAAALAIERAVADRWDEKLGQLERRIAQELRREKLAIRDSQQAAFREQLAAERERQLSVDKAEAQAARKRRNAAIVMMIVELD